MSKTFLREQAIQLRKEGFSYAFIRDRLKVSKSTLSKWLKDMPFEPNSDFVDRVNRTHSQLTDLRRKVRVQSETEAKRLAVDDMGSFSQRDLFMLGLGIYMGEGSKTVCLRVVNSDPSVVRTAIEWFRKIYGLQEENFGVRIHLYPDCDPQKSLEYWSQNLGLGLKRFYPVQIDKRQNKSLRNSGKLLFGTAHVTIRSCKKKEFGVLLRRRILNSIEIAKSRAGLV